MAGRCAARMTSTGRRQEQHLQGLTRVSMLSLMRTLCSMQMGVCSEATAFCFVDFEPLLSRRRLIVLHLCSVLAQAQQLGLQKPAKDANHIAPSQQIRVLMSTLSISNKISGCHH